MEQYSGLSELANLDINYFQSKWKARRLLKDSGCVSGKTLLLHLNPKMRKSDSGLSYTSSILYLSLTFCCFFKERKS